VGDERPCSFNSIAAFSKKMAWLLNGVVGLANESASLGQRTFHVKISERSIDIYDGAVIGLSMVSIWGSVVWILVGLLIR